MHPSDARGDFYFGIGSQYSKSCHYYKHICIFQNKNAHNQRDKGSTPIANTVVSNVISEDSSAPSFPYCSTTIGIIAAQGHAIETTQTVFTTASMGRKYTRPMVTKGKKIILTNAVSTAFLLWISCKMPSFPAMAPIYISDSGVDIFPSMDMASMTKAGSNGVQPIKENTKPAKTMTQLGFISFCMISFTVIFSPVLPCSTRTA